MGFEKNNMNTFSLGAQEIERKALLVYVVAPIYHCSQDKIRLLKIMSLFGVPG